MSRLFLFLAMIFIWQTKYGSNDLVNLLKVYLNSTLKTNYRKLNMGETKKLNSLRKS